MVHKLKIGIVGYGAIGSSLADAIKKDFSKQAQLAALYDLDLSKIKNKKLAVGSLKKLIERSELVIEAASAKVSWEIARQVLIKGRDMMIMSVGGVAAHSKELKALAQSKGAKVYIPSGAICGLDGLKATGLKKISKVMLTTRKNPISLKGNAYLAAKGIDLNRITRETIVFQGSAKQAVKFFPQNINVAAVLSLAGIGQERTRVRLIVDPNVHKNIHEVTIEAEAANIFTRAENILHPRNPKTSYLAPLSAIAVLKQILEPVKIGT